MISRYEVNIRTKRAMVDIFNRSSVAKVVELRYKQVQSPKASPFACWLHSIISDKGDISELVAGLPLAPVRDPQSVP